MGCCGFRFGGKLVWAAIGPPVGGICPGVGVDVGLKVGGGCEAAKPRRLVCAGLVVWLVRYAFGDSFHGLVPVYVDLVSHSRRPSGVSRPSRRKSMRTCSTPVREEVKDG